MNAGQMKFRDFIIDRVKEEYKEHAEKLLQESFQKQMDGTFDLEFLQEFKNSMLGFLKPEAVKEVTAIMEQFGNNFRKG